MRRSRNIATRTWLGAYQGAHGSKTHEERVVLADAALLAVTGVQLVRKDYGWTEAIQPSGLCYEARGTDKGATLDVLARCTARERWA